MTTYYVDAVSGSDSNGGESPGDAWQTVTKVNGFSFSAGDSILFRRGQTWTNRLDLDAVQGTSGSRITFADWDSGDKPRIYALKLTHCHYLTFQNLRITNGSPGVEVLGTSQYINWEYCDIEDNPGSGTMIWTPGYGNCIFDHCVFQRNGTAASRGHGVFIKADSYTLRYCTITNNATGDPDYGKSHNIYIDSGGLKFTVHHCEISYSGNGHGLASKSSLDAYNNYVHHNDIAGILCSGWDIATGDSETFTLWNNVVTNNGIMGIAKYGDASNTYYFYLYWYHNTCYNNCTNGGSWGADFYVEQEVAELDLRNNVAYNNLSNRRLMDIVSQTSVTIDYNDWYVGNTGVVITYAGSAYSTFSSYQSGAGFDTHGIGGDPLFTDAASGSFMQQHGSPVIDAGTNVGITADYDGSARPKGGGYDIGAYEFVPERTYYVDAVGGSDSNSGTSPGDAWQTVTKVNNTTLNPGDTVLFNRSDVFENVILRLNHSGTSGSPITYGAYGTGLRPIISMTNGSQALYTGTARSYVVLEDLDFDVNGGHSYAGQIRLSYSTIDNCVFREASSIGLLLTNGAEVTIKNCFFHSNGGYAGLELYVENGGSQTDFVIEDNEAYNNGGSQGHHGIYIVGYPSVGNSTGHIVRRNTCYNNADAGIKLNTTEDCEIYDNVCYGNANGLSITTEETMTSSGHLIYNNILRDNSQRGLWFHGDTNDTPNGEVNNCEVYNNTIVNNHNSYGAGIHISGGTGHSGNVFKNNIVYNDDSLGSYPPLRLHSTVESNNTFDYNCWYWANNGSGYIAYIEGVGSYVTLSTWKGYGGHDNDIGDNPDFEDIGADNYMIQPASPCLNTGTTVASVTVDIDGTIRPIGSAYDMGAYEYFGITTTTHDAGIYVGRATISRGATGPQYILNDEFTTAESAPLSSPRSCEPGPGVLGLVQTDGEFSVGGGALNIPAQSTPVDGDQGFYGSTSRQRANGRSVLAKINVSTWNWAGFGWHSAAAVPAPSSMPHCIQLLATSGSLGKQDDYAIFSGLSTSTDYWIMVVLGATRTKYLLHDGSNWRLMWVDTDTATPLYPVYTGYQGAMTMDNLRIIDQGAPFNSDTGLADYADTTPTDGDTFTHSDDLILDFTVDTLPGTGEAIRVAFRIQDSQNLCYAYINSSGDTYVYERIGNVNNNRGGDTGIASAGTRIVVKAYGSQMSLYVNGVLETTYNSLGFDTETSGEFNGTTVGGTAGGAISDLYLWPETLDAADEPQTQLAAGQTVSASTKTLAVSAPVSSAKSGAVVSANAGTLSITTSSASITMGAVVKPPVADLSAAGQSAYIGEAKLVQAGTGVITTHGEPSGAVLVGNVIAASSTLLGAITATNTVATLAGIVARVSDLLAAAQWATAEPGAVQPSMVVGLVTVLGETATVILLDRVIAASPGSLRAFGEGAAAHFRPATFIKPQPADLNATPQSATQDVPTRLRITWVEFGVPLASGTIVTAESAELDATGAIGSVPSEEDILPRMTLGVSGVYKLGLATENVYVVGPATSGRYILIIRDM